MHDMQLFGKVNDDIHCMYNIEDLWGKPQGKGN